MELFEEIHECGLIDTAIGKHRRISAYESSALVLGPTLWDDYRAWQLSSDHGMSRCRISADKGMHDSVDGTLGLFRRRECF